MRIIPSSKSRTPSRLSRKQFIRDHESSSTDHHLTEMSLRRHEKDCEDDQSRDPPQ